MESGFLKQGDQPGGNPRRYGWAEKRGPAPAVAGRRGKRRFEKRGTAVGKRTIFAGRARGSKPGGQGRQKGKRCESRGEK